MTNYQIFNEKFWPLNPKGKPNSSKDNARNLFQDIVVKQNMSADYLIKKYKEYLDYINATHHKQRMTNSYLSKKLTIEEWLQNAKWEEDYSIEYEEDPIDQYLYGDDGPKEKEKKNE